MQVVADLVPYLVKVPFIKPTVGYGSRLSIVLPTALRCWLNVCNFLLKLTYMEWGYTAIMLCYSFNTIHSCFPSLKETVDSWVIG